MDRLAQQLFICFLALAAILVLEYYTDIDLWIQDLLYVSESRQWVVNPLLHQKLTWFFYKGPKFFYGAVCFSAVVYLLLSRRVKSLRRHNRSVWVLLLSLVLVPLIVASAKYFTNVYCPYQLNVYNGAYPFVRILEAYPADFVQLKNGRCFPAGHATVGFAFMALYFCFHDRLLKWCGVAFGLTLGWTTAVYQMFRGQHFLSHGLFTMVASLAVILLVNYAVRFFYEDKLQKRIYKRGN